MASTADTTLTPGAMAHLVGEACDHTGLIGQELRAHLRKEITAKVLLRQARDVVLISGPTGVGKEMVAATIHHAAQSALGRGGKLVEVNCANLGGGLFESELFGHRRGAYTGADRDYAGLVGQAQGGTLVLDEIQSLEPQDQARLLRFLGEREYRAVGDDKVRSTDALIVLSTNRNLREMVQCGTFRRDLLDRAAAKMHVPSLHERRRDIGELAQAFALEAAADIGAGDDFMGLTRRARAHIETAVIRSSEVSVRRLRELIRDMVFMAAADGLGDALESEHVVGTLERELAFTEEHREAQDRQELEEDLELLVSQQILERLTRHHGVSTKALGQWVRAMHALINDMDDRPRTYRNVVERTQRLSKVALWLVSGAKSQAEFRRYFGELQGHMPTKSVAHQIFHDVFPKDPT